MAPNVFYCEQAGGSTVYSPFHSHLQYNFLLADNMCVSYRYVLDYRLSFLSMFLHGTTISLS